MGRASVEATLRKIVLKNARLKVAFVSVDDRLVKDLGFDSLSFLTLLSDLEDAFGVAFPVEQVDDLQEISFGGLCGMIQEKLGTDVAKS